MTFPKYNKINLYNTELKWGYYILGLIEQYRSDIELIGIALKPVDQSRFDDQWHVACSHKDVDYSWLPARIDQALRQNKKVALIVEDEHVFYEKNDQLTEIINYYHDQPVYWISQLDQRRAISCYKHQHNFKCKIIELPWVNLNECLVYNNVKNHRTPSMISGYGNISKNKFFTVTGKYEPFRKSLLEKLIEQNLNYHGTLTVPNSSDEVNKYNLGRKVSVEPYHPYSNIPIIEYDKMAAQFLENNIWLSSNTKNFLHLEKTYLRYPLAIIPETSVYDYFLTEKSFWPILLGKLFLILGPPNCMRLIQRFYDINLSEFLNLDFDKTYYSDLKLELMIEKNKNFILNSHKFHKEYYSKIQQARNSLGRNMYAFCLEQIEKIQ
jgi:hypothetical protein